MDYCTDCDVCVEGETIKDEEGERCCPYCEEPVACFSEDPPWR